MFPKKFIVGNLVLSNENAESLRQFAKMHQTSRKRFENLTKTRTGEKRGQLRNTLTGERSGDRVGEGSLGKSIGNVSGPHVSEKKKFDRQRNVRSLQGLGFRV